jgi:cytochrome b pre-mRNA-processing protein 3
LAFPKLFRPRAAERAGQRLYQAVAAQARAPAFYADLGVPDTVEGRFELYNLHVILVLRRLRGEGGAAAEASQALFDAFIEHLDVALREMGVGDLSMAKKMRKLGEAFYGRAKRYDQALDNAPDDADLTALIGRTLLADAPAGEAARLATYVREASRTLAEQPVEAILEGAVQWPAA